MIPKLFKVYERGFYEAIAFVLDQAIERADKKGGEIDGTD
jgi:hypothetical protein